MTSTPLICEFDVNQNSKETVISYLTLESERSGLFSVEPNQDVDSILSADDPSGDCIATLVLKVNYDEEYLNEHTLLSNIRIKSMSDIGCLISLGQSSSGFQR